tara:strand:+ start:373 stop:567 length:195 start_codon:yes stop_codon:yes gene_type:complete
VQKKELIYNMQNKRAINFTVLFQEMYICPSLKQRGGRAVYGARLESVLARERLEGSNPFLSAIL